MERAAALREVLSLGFASEAELQRFVEGYDAELAGRRSMIPLAELLVEDALQRHRVEELIAALRRHQRSLAILLARYPALAAPAIQPVMGHPGKPSRPATNPSSPAALPYLGEGPAAGGAVKAAGPERKGLPFPETRGDDDGPDETRGDEASRGDHAAPSGNPRPPKKAQPGGTSIDHDQGPPQTAALPTSPFPSPLPTSTSRPSRPPAPPQQLSLGFASPEAPTSPLDKHRTLASGALHLLWVTLSPEHIAGSLSRVAAIEGAREGDELDVIIFAFPGQLALEGPRLGRIRLARTGNQVVRAAQSVAGAAPATLYFNVRTPDSPGRCALRVNVYCRGVLLQSHLVTAEVSARPVEQSEALDRKLDYNLSASLAASRLAPSDGCRVSLLLNDDGHGTHSFRFVSSQNGVPDSIGDAHLDGAQLASAVSYARGALRWAAWGSEAPWDGKTPCRLADTLDRRALEPALVGMAVRGANLYMQLAAQFAFTGKANDELREHMRVPGRVQLALKESADAIFPIALVYDYPLDTDLQKHGLCPAALAAMEARKDLADEPCFQGQCPFYDADDIVCPGGFWGFRHDLGLPLHVRGGEVATEIPRGDKVRAFAAISTDKNFVLRDQHLGALAKLGSDWLEILNERRACLARLKEARQLVYFYCHGGLTAKKVPFLQIGALDSDAISAQALFNARIHWPEPLRPLVLLSGCHTTATAADELFSMLTAFASHCNAAGIVGTEITNFELIAKLFGEKMLALFLGGEQLGRAVRLARLELLRLGNPLGLMYISFALPSLHLA